MAWKEHTALSERMGFVIRLEAGERMSDLCREFGISRKTGYKFWNRYKAKGPEGLFDQSRRPHHSPGRLPKAIRDLVLETKREYPSWGAKKLKAYIERENPGVSVPAQSTIHGLLPARQAASRRRLVGGADRAEHAPRS